MKLPSHVVIFGQKVKVETLDLGPTTCGLYYSHGLIQIDNKLKGINLDHTLVHEVFHAVFSRCSLDQRVSLDLEEMIVELLSKALVENFKIEKRK